MKTLKPLLILIAILFGTAQGLAGDKDTRLVVGTGLLYENGWDATIGVEKEGAHHAAWEFFGTAYLKWKKCESCGHVCPESFWHYYNTWGGGITYKPCVSLGRNHLGSLRIGGWLGSDLHHVIGAVTLGYEHSYCLKHGWQVYWQAKTEIVIEGKDLFRTGLAIGVKLPL